jgi:hypothetical protein
MEFTTIKIAGADALRVLDEHRARYRATRQYPFLIGDAEDLEFLREYIEDEEHDPAEILHASFDVDPAAWIAERRAGIEEDSDGWDDAEIVGEWPGGEVGKVEIGLHKDVVTGEIKPEVYMGLATVDEPWLLPAILNYGNWNDCPPPEVHAAFHRDWLRRYGAEIVGMSNDVVQCLVKNPPRDREAAMALAWEQYWYCSDIVEQGCESIANLAATLLDSPRWYFWWD